MVLRRPLPLLSNRVQAPAPGSTAPELETGKHKTVTVRMPPRHQNMLTAISAAHECDRSEAIKRAISREHAALQAYESRLTLTDERGKETTIPIKIKGKPC